MIDIYWVRGKYNFSNSLMLKVIELLVCGFLEKILQLFIVCIFAIVFSSTA